ncbi:Mov34/MPN/PAD-1 family protein [Cupriavidus necator]|uniref:Mov34/MPN/PAD-1 family protein n=1 Tax=Cupriavidus necator TaxID=106590 RepID=UPI003F73B7E6
MTSNHILFRLPRANWSLLFSDAALLTFDKHVQRRVWSKESVGQLFTRSLISDCIVVEVATVLKPTWAVWSRVQFDTARAMAEREAMFKQGLHSVGLWHTHPEPVPHPSIEDRALAREHALAAQPQLTGLVFAIVGTKGMPQSLRVWVDDGQELRLAEAV